MADDEPTEIKVNTGGGELTLRPKEDETPVFGQTTVHAAGGGHRHVSRSAGEAIGVMKNPGGAVTQRSKPKKFQRPAISLVSTGVPKREWKHLNAHEVSPGDLIAEFGVLTEITRLPGEPVDNVQLTSTYGRVEIWSMYRTVYAFVESA